MTSLKPCKYCGNLPILLRWKIDYRIESSYTCVNQECIQKRLEEEAINKWNKEN